MAGIRSNRVFAASGLYQSTPIEVRNVLVSCTAAAVVELYEQVDGGGSPLADSLHCTLRVPANETKGYRFVGTWLGLYVKIVSGTGVEVAVEVA